MRKSFLLFVLSVVTVSALASEMATDDGARIDRVRRKAASNDVLTNADFVLIDDFIAITLEDIVRFEDYLTFAELRRHISTRKGTKEPSQYSAVFNKSAKEHIKWAFEQVALLEPSRRKSEAQGNLVILIAELDNPDLVPQVVPMLASESETIKYWSVKALTSPSVTEKLNSADSDKEFSAMIIKALKSQVATAPPETLTLMVDFVAKLKDPGANQILRDIADIRIKAYENWSTEQMLVDTDLLKALASRITDPRLSSDKVLFGRKFAQLYSYIIQRYIMTAESSSPQVVRHLISVIIEIESSTLFELTGKRQSTIKKAIEGRKFSTLNREHDELLGSENAPGLLPAAVGFDYGKQDGKTLIAPKKLPQKPKPQPDSQPKQE